MERSHRKTHLQQQATRNLLFVFGGIIVLLILFFTVGPNLLINFATVLNKMQGTNTQTPTAKKEAVYIAPPILNNITDATKSAEITIEGYAQPKQTITLFINGNKTEKAMVNNNKKFTFHAVKLKKGANTIKAQAANDEGRTSDYSNTMTVSYYDTPPKLEITSPQDGQTISKDNRNITISGKAESDAKVTINGSWTISNDDGTFSSKMQLADGETTITIIATDKAGNTTEKQLKVKVE